MFMMMSNSTASTTNNVEAKLDRAFEKIDRANFLPHHLRDLAHVNLPVPIGHDQTNSQPSTVYKMLKWLDTQPGDKVLDIGSGSAWTTALLAHLVGEDGYVYGIDKIPELVQLGAENCRKISLKNINIQLAGDSLGLPSQAPFDRILVSASAKELPTELIDQLKIGGTMVVPVKNSIFILRKTGHDSHFTTEQPGFAFVPLVDNKGERV